MPIPDDFVLDIHDFAAIILDTHARIDPPFGTSKLVEVTTGTGRIRTYEDANLVIPSEWQSAQDKPRVAYIHDLDHASQDTTTVDTLASPGKLLTPGDRALSRRDIEDAFWRCKTLSNGSFLGDTAHRVLSSLPRTVQLRIRTSRGYEFTCTAHDVCVLLNKVSPHESCFVSERAQYLVGFGNRLSWPVLLLGGSSGSSEHSVVLDLAIAQVGGRGLGGELFALESVEEYKVKLLPKYAVSAEECVGKMYVFNPSGMTMEQRERQGVLVPEIMRRLAKIANGQDDFCRHCGKDNINLRCSRCKRACFCLACLELGWKYHEVWCS
ncbi:hypothetical protein C8Q80DRAFT_1116414 [Daedaleopsis nitida]|nr:hypothetical protein C8Q80DRAFT_1116414 [Daedaleopsis nitida]